MNEQQKLLTLQFINDNIDSFHASRLRFLHGLKLEDILRRKNPYLFRAKNIQTADELVNSIVDASLSSSEEGLFGRFLEEVAIFVNNLLFGGQKSSTTGIDLEFNRDDTRYVLAIKSGLNWGNSSQHAALRLNFSNAVKVLRQSRQVRHAQAVLGICYGQSQTIERGDYTLMSGKDFWEFISGDAELYIDLISLVAFHSQEHNERFFLEKLDAVQRITDDFAAEFCGELRQVDWQKLIIFNSGPKSPRKSRSRK